MPVRCGGARVCARARIRGSKEGKPGQKVPRVPPQHMDWVGNATCAPLHAGWPKKEVTSLAGELWLAADAAS